MLRTTIVGITFAVACSVGCCPPGSVPDIVADAGEDQVVGPGQEVTLGANDPADGQAARFTWVQLTGSAVELSEEGDVMPTFAAPESGGTLAFRLTVIDRGNEGCLGLTSDIVTVIVVSAPCDPQDDDCGSDEFCRTPIGECDDPGAEGFCLERPDVCTEEFAPVCGCDGETYDNLCFAYRSGVNVAETGECD